MGPDGGRSASERSNPSEDDSRGVGHDLTVGPIAAGRNVKAVIGAIDAMRCGQWPPPLHDTAQQRQLRELVLSAVDEKHRDLDSFQVLGTRGRWFASRMQREAEKNEADHAGQRPLRLRLRRHAPAEGFAASDDRQTTASPAGLGNRCPDRRMRGDRTIRPQTSSLHEWKLETERGDAMSV
jgi:hypothetical protein